MHAIKFFLIQFLRNDSVFSVEKFFVILITAKIFWSHETHFVAKNLYVMLICDFALHHRYAFNADKIKAMQKILHGFSVTKSDGENLNCNQITSSAP